MQLFYTPNSPYARIARVAVREAGLLPQVRERAAANRRPDNPVLAHSPVGRVPTLVVDGLVLTEAKTVHAYLMHGGGCPLPVDVDWRGLEQEGQIIGFLDGIAVWIRESRREPETRSAFLLGVEANRAQRCLKALEGDAGRERLPDVPVFRAAALAAALALIDLHDLVPSWREAQPALALWFDTQAARPSMLATAPSL